MKFVSRSTCPLTSVSAVTPSHWMSTCPSAFVGGALGPDAHLLPEVEADGLRDHRQLDRPLLTLSFTLGSSPSARLADLGAGGRRQGEECGQNDRHNLFAHVSLLYSVSAARRLRRNWSQKTASQITTPMIICW